MAGQTVGNFPTDRFRDSNIAFVYVPSLETPSGFSRLRFSSEFGIRERLDAKRPTCLEKVTIKFTVNLTRPLGRPFRRSINSIPPDDIAGNYATRLRHSNVRHRVDHKNLLFTIARRALEPLRSLSGRRSSQIARILPSRAARS